MQPKMITETYLTRPNVQMFAEMDRRGYSQMPIRGKVPFIKEWQQFCETKRDFSPLEYQGLNAGICCGPASKTIVIDVDDSGCFKALCEVYGWEEPETFTVDRGREYKHHSYYEYPDDGNEYGCRSIKHPVFPRHTVFDIKGKGGQVVAPGSTHPDTGKSYKIIKDIPKAPPPDWLLKILNRAKVNTDMLRNVPPHADAATAELIKSMKISDRIKELILNGKVKGERSEALMTVLCALVGVGIQNNIIFYIFENYPIGEKYREKEISKIKWLESEIKSAKEHVGASKRTQHETSYPPPIDIFGDTSLAGVPDFPDEACPKTLDDFARDSADRIGVDPGMVALPCIVVAAATTDDEIKIQPKRYDTEWTESARLWIAIEAESGSKKTPVLDTVTKPLKEIERRYFTEDSELVDVYEKQIEEYERAKKKSKSGEPSKPIRPPQRRLIVDDITVEAFCNVLKDNPRGVLCLKDELSGWIGSFDAYHANRGKDRAAYIELYNGGPKLVDRVRRGRTFIHNWSACLLGGIQPGPMKRLYGKISDDGLLQRFIVIRPKYIDRGQDRPPKYSLITKYIELINYLISLKPESKRPIQFSEHAQQEREIIANVAQSMMILPDTSPAFRAHLSKWEGLFARIALTYHVIESFEKGSEYPPGSVTQETAARAARLMLDYLLPNAARFYSETIGCHSNLIHARWIADYILSRKLNEVTDRDIYHAYRTLRNKPEKRYQAMQTLTLSGWVRPTKMGKNNTPNKWEIDKRVHSIFAVRAEEERKHREEERLKIARAVKMLGMEGGNNHE